ncbi:amastin-like surface protein [Leishmania donovani]|uniref:Amastin surface glycofamily protein n=1 Tax=Leishmania donovani TaxID=5661 RepID=A0A6J8FN75_LEIDO|nr:amastin-like surface protein [Leishmania donovani]VDZ48359.1 amastin-like_surface_protein_putative/GeneDB:LmjF.34.1560/GeneDB:LmjF.34.1580/GeneDB:LmjF.34.1600/GeneDB:LmjF.34.1620/GeneDB:LmjF.34.1640/GeneDB:LmjF.34.1660/GeneDB:LmjF.34.1680/GeneDB:LmjF.34.1700/GeneDB:LmjF.34.1720/GeneDB:LmjF.34.1740/GeneDB:LmjF.34.1760/GeneDB:LmjF.34.1780/GeneDB:LmjF.34.1800/GeneDB:LmjF.34.1820/GeneDB:LmjF.34.1860/GeneDB:LmjF.34.1880/GeneDB:LmjF.34.1900/GeneDB:LmjF.34.1920/GeneDB:LmjF.34.1940/GeneDB:LmjF.34.1960/
MTPSIPLILYVVLQFVAFLLMLVGTPLDIVRRRDVAAGIPLTCMTLWGFKVDCFSVDYSITIDVLFGACPPRINRFRVAQVFVVLSILVYGAACILDVMLLCGISLLRWVCLALNVVGSVTLCVVWAAMARTFLKDDGPQCSSFREVNKYGPGFILLVVAWILDTLNIILLLLPCTSTEGAEYNKEQPLTAQE